MADTNNIQADQQYRTAVAERGKFWVVDKDYLTSLGYPASGEGKYATLTYQVNPTPMSLSGDLIVEVDSEGTVATTATPNVMKQGGIAETTIPVPVADGETVAAWFNEYGQQVIAGFNQSLSAIDVNQVNTGGIAETTVPVAVADGDPVNVWYNEYGQQVIAGYNQSLNALDVNQVNPAMLQRMGPLNSLTDADEIINGAAVDVSNYHNITCNIIASSVGVDGATLVIEHSLDGENWVNLSTYTITTDGVEEFAVTNVAYKYVRTNVVSYDDGSYTTLLYCGN